MKKNISEGTRKCNKQLVAFAIGNLREKSRGAKKALIIGKSQIVVLSKVTLGSMI